MVLDQEDEAMLAVMEKGKYYHYLSVLLCPLTDLIDSRGHNLVMVGLGLVL